MSTTSLKDILRTSLPLGPQGPQGPVGPQGPAGNTDTGNVIFSGTELSILPGSPETNITINVETTVFNGNLIPSSNNTYSLGSLDNQWKSLYVSNNTVYIDNVAVSVSNNTLTVNNEPVVTYNAASNTFVANGFSVSANTGEITFNNDTIDSNTGNINIPSYVTIDNSLRVTGDISLDGNLVIGNVNTDTVSVIADFTSNLVPDVSNTYSLGTSNKQWKNIHVATANVETINISGNLVASGSSTLKVGGTTSVNTSYISANVIVSGPTETTYNVFTTNADSPIIIDSFPSPDFTTVKYIIQCKSPEGNHATELFCMQDGIEAYLTEYATLISNYTLGTYTLEISGGYCHLYFNPNNPMNNIITVKLVRTALTS